MNDLKNTSSKKAIAILKNTIERYALSKINREGFLKIREKYNEGENTWDMFYAMLTNSFNYQIRFNKQGKYNMPFGKDRSSFNPKLEQKFIKFVDKINQLNIKFTNKDFKELKIEKLSNQDFVYCDPPYLITVASYNESGGWTEKDEKDLLRLLDNLDSEGIRFALSNVLESKGESNNILKKWSNKYIVHDLDFNYNNSNYHKRDKNKHKNREVLITNY